MCVKLSPRDLNPDFCPSYPTSIYICRVTTVLRESSGVSNLQHRKNEALLRIKDFKP